MNNPLANRTVIVPAGLTGIIEDIEGRHVKLVSCTLASVLMGFDGGPTERVYPDDCYAGPSAGFRHLRFVADVGACTIVIQVSQQPILGGSNTSLVAVQALLSTINTRLAAATTKVGTRSGAIAQTGVGSTVILAANAARKSGFVQADINNTGRVWLGRAVGVTQADSWFELLPGATSPELLDTVGVWACSENGTELVRYYETT